MGTEPADPQAIANHLRSWAVKGFYLAFMLAIVPGGFGDFIRADTAALFDDPVALANWLITFMFVVDVGFARSEEHTSELQSLMRISYAVFCLKKKKPRHTNQDHLTHKSRTLQITHTIPPPIVT